LLPGVRMKCFPLLLLFFSGSASTIAAQLVVVPRTDTELLNKIEWQGIRRKLDRLDALNKQPRTDPRLPAPEPTNRIIIDALYRHSTNSEAELLAASDVERAKYAEFLKQDGTGLTKLIRDFGCDEYSSAATVAQLCDKFSMPGGGSAFSFRRADYQQWKLSDMLYDGRSFIAFGEMSLGFLADVGKVPLEQVDKNTNGVPYLFDFAPKAKKAEVTAQNSLFVEGVTSGGFLYKKFVPVAVGDTYVIRNVAFRGKVPNRHYDIVYNELDFDKREDLVVTFTVLDEDINGTVTILWKVLHQQRSPVLEQK